MKTKRRTFPKRIKNINHIDDFLDDDFEEKRSPKKMKYDDEDEI